MLIHNRQTVKSDLTNNNWEGTNGALQMDLEPQPLDPPPANPQTNAYLNHIFNTIGRPDPRELHNSIVSQIHDFLLFNF